MYRHPMAKEGNSPFGYIWEYGCALAWEFLFACWIYLRHGFHVIQGCNPPDDIFLVALPFKLFGVSTVSITTTPTQSCIFPNTRSSDFFTRFRSG